MCQEGQVNFIQIAAAGKMDARQCMDVSSCNPAEHQSDEMHTIECAGGMLYLQTAMKEGHDRHLQEDRRSILSQDLHQPIHNSTLLKQATSAHAAFLLATKDAEMYMSADDTICLHHRRHTD